jgi:tetratricopeptide (TPR) repeat protein
VRVPINRLVGIVIGSLLAAHVILLGFSEISDSDTWWHLKQGELYVTTRSLPAQDPFSFTTAGREWIKYSWLADVIFYLVFRAGGTPGLVLLRLLLLLLIALILYRLLRGCDLHPFASVLFVFVASIALGLRLWIRPEILSFPLLLAVMAILLWLQAAPPRAAYALLPVQVVWTNVHASFVFGLALPGLVLLANLLPGTRLAPGWGRLCLDRPRLRHLAAAVACLPLASLLSPNGVSLLLFPFRQNHMTRLTWFTEWKPVWFFLRFDPTWLDVPIILGLIFLAFAITVVLLLVWEGRFDPVGWGVVLSMGTYAVFRLRAIPYFVLTILPLLALAIVRIASHLPAIEPGRQPQRLGRMGALACLLVLSASIVSQVFLLPSAVIQHRFGLRPYRLEGATAFLERYQLNGRVFNAYEFGGYIIWRRWPANQVLIDGRYDGVLFDEALLDAHIEAHQSAAALDRLAVMYGTDILVLSAQPGRGMPFLNGDPNWVRVYWDPVAEVYVKKGGRYAELIATHEYRLTRPEWNLSYLAAYRHDRDTWAQALAELRRAVTDNPDNALAWLSLAQEYRAAGPAAASQRLEALTRAQALLAGTPLVGRVHADRAETLLQLGQLDEAAAEAKTALRSQEDLILPRSILADVAQRRGAWGEARDQLQTILARMGPADARTPGIRERLEAVERHLNGDRSQ